MKQLSREQVNMCWAHLFPPVKDSMNETNVYLKCGLQTKERSIPFTFVLNCPLSAKITSLFHLSPAIQN